MGALVKPFNFKNLATARKKVKYVCFRERQSENEKLGVFSKDTDNADVKGFMNILDDKKTCHPSVNVMHELMFSMSRDEWEKSGFQYGDYKTLVRDAMQKYENITGQRLTWVAAEHNNKNNPHCHVMIKAVYHDRDDVPHRLTWYKWDKATRGQSKEQTLIRACFQESKNDLRGFELEVPYKENTYEKQRLSPAKSVTKDLTNNIGKPLLYSILQRIKEAKRQEERERENDYDYRS